MKKPLFVEYITVVSALFIYMDNKSMPHGIGGEKIELFISIVNKH